MDELDWLLAEAQGIRANKAMVGAVLPTVPISRTVLEFAQKVGAIKYREMRKIFSALAKWKKLEAEFYLIASKKLGFMPDNWAFFFLKGRRESDSSIYIPELIEEGRGLVAKVEEIQNLIGSDSEVCMAHDLVKRAWFDVDIQTAAVSSWILDEFRSGGLEAKILRYKQRHGAKKKTMISKTVMYNLMNPEKAEVIKQTGDLPDLSIGEREALQFLLGKINSMTEREKHLHSKLLGGADENPEKHGYLVVFERSDALRKNYGNIRLSGYHYANFERSLYDLLEKKRRLLIEASEETLELSLCFLKRVDMRHKFHKDPEFRSYIAVWIPYELARLHDKKYTAFQDNHFAQIRSTPPKTIPDKTEVLFFDFLQSEAPFKKQKAKTVHKKKNTFLEFIGGAEVAAHCNKTRLADRVEKLYARKAMNMGILNKFSVKRNADFEEVYVFEFSRKQ